MSFIIGSLGLTYNPVIIRVPYNCGTGILGPFLKVIISGPGYESIHLHPHQKNVDCLSLLDKV